MWRCTLKVLILGSVMLISPICWAQEPIRVAPCDLITAPEKYSGKVVQVTARVYLAFEDFSLAQPGCEEAYPGVWLIYGGDEPTPTSSTVNDRSRKPGSVMKVNGIPIPLVHDAALKLFTQRLNPVRITPIDDRSCYDCYLYRVSATITGVFFAAKKDAKSFSGYGHLGCCNLLAIEQVADVTAERTAVPMGGSCHCETEKRNLNATEAQQLKALDNSCKGLSDRQCFENRGRQMASAASYLGDVIHPEEGFYSGGEIIGNSVRQAWESADKLKKYTLAIESDDPLKDESLARKGVITRAACTAVVPPLPMTAITSCRNLWSDFGIHREDAEEIARKVASGEQSWRTGVADHASPEALKQAAEKWGITPARNLSPAKCDSPIVVEGDQFVWCNWNDKNGMQLLSVQVTRFGYLRHGKSWRSVPWVLTRGDGIVCEVEN